MSDRRYRAALQFDEGMTFYVGEYCTAADADRAADEVHSRHRHWTECFNEASGKWEVLTYTKATFHYSGRDVLIDIDNSGRFELFSSCANEVDARHMAKHYQQLHNPD